MSLFKKRSQDMMLFPCPICGKKPYVDISVSSGEIWCRGYGMHIHPKVYVYIDWELPSKLIKKLFIKWNVVGFIRLDSVMFDTNKAVEGLYQKGQRIT